MLGSSNRRRVISLTTGASRRQVALERDTAWLSSADAASLVMGMVVHVILTRSLLSGEYGLWVLLLDMFHVAFVLIDLGLPTIIGRDLDRLGMLGRKLVHRSLALQIPAMVVLVPAATLLSLRLTGAASVWLTPAILLAGSAALQVLAYSHRSALRALGEARKEAVVRIIDRAGVAVGLVIAQTYLPGRLDVLAIAVLAGPVLALLYAALVGERQMLLSASEPTLALPTSSMENKELLSAGLPFLLASSALIIQVRIEKILLGTIGDVEALASYQIAWLAFIAGYAPILSLRAMLLSHFGEVRTDITALLPRFERSRKLVSLALIPSLIIGWFGGGMMIPFLFPEYSQSAEPLFRILLAAWALALIASPPLTIVQISDKPWRYTRALWWGIGADALACVVLIPRIGAEGAAWSACVGALVVLIIALMEAGRSAPRIGENSEE